MFNHNGQDNNWNKELVLHGIPMLVSLRLNSLSNNSLNNYFHNLPNNQILHRLLCGLHLVDILHPLLSILLNLSHPPPTRPILVIQSINKHLQHLLKVVSYSHSNLYLKYQVKQQPVHCASPTSTTDNPKTTPPSAPGHPTSSTPSTSLDLQALEERLGATLEKSKKL